MKKVLLFSAVVLLALASFTTINNEKTVLKDIDGTLLKSYAVIDNVENTITFTVDANTTVSSSVIDGEFRIFLVENGASNKNVTHTLKIKKSKSLSFDNYFEGYDDVASSSDSKSIKLVGKRRPRFIM